LGYTARPFQNWLFNLPCIRSWVQSSLKVKPKLLTTDLVDHIFQQGQFELGCYT
jgi:hypothetical protein